MIEERDWRIQDSGRHAADACIIEGAVQLSVFAVNAAEECVDFVVSCQIGAHIARNAAVGGDSACGFGPGGFINTRYDDLRALPRECERRRPTDSRATSGDQNRLSRKATHGLLLVAHDNVQPPASDRPFLHNCVVPFCLCHRIARWHDSNHQGDIMRAIALLAYAAGALAGTGVAVAAQRGPNQEWLSVNGDPANQRYVALEQINLKTVAKLGAAWVSKPFLEGATSRMTPLVSAPAKGAVSS